LPKYSASAGVSNPAPVITPALSIMLFVKPSFEIGMNLIFFSMVSVFTSLVKTSNLMPGALCNWLVITFLE